MGDKGGLTGMATANLKSYKVLIDLKSIKMFVYNRHCNMHKH